MLSKTITDIGVPVLVFIAMIVVGMELTIADFRRVVRQPWLITAAILGQIVLLPALGWLLASFVPHQLVIAEGILLVTACPSGAMANLYTLLGRGNVALSVTLTAVSCLAAALTTPVTISVLQIDERGGHSVPLGILIGQLVILLVVPVLAGMGVRHRWPVAARRHARSLLGIGVASLMLLLLLVILEQAHQFASAYSELMVAAGILTMVGFGAGWLAGTLSGANVRDRFTVGIVFVVRNVGIATAVAVTALGRSEFAVFATAYFLAQMPLLLALALSFRLGQPSDQSPALDAENP